MNKNVSDQEAKRSLNRLNKQAEEMIRDPDKLGQFLQNIENKLSTLPQVGESLSSIPTLVSMLRSYLKKEYTEIPYKSLIAIVGALLYFLAPIDIIPDFIPVVGYVDDAAVLAFALKQVKDDVDAYKQCRDEKQLAK